MVIEKFNRKIQKVSNKFRQCLDFRVVIKCTFIEFGCLVAEIFEHFTF